MKKPANFLLENKLWSKNVGLVAGADEVGRGAWAGPVVAAAVIFPRNILFPEKLFDSKKLSSSARERLSDLIWEKADAVSIGEVGVFTINKKGILSSTHQAFRQALKNLPLDPDHILVDAFYIQRVPKAKQNPIVRGDEICASISAASIVAKVYRDRVMRGLSKKFPGYYFEKNKGYGTREHQDAIREKNFTSIHRTSFNLGYLTR